MRRGRGRGAGRGGRYYTVGKGGTVWVQEVTRERQSGEGINDILLTVECAMEKMSPPPSPPVRPPASLTALNPSLFPGHQVRQPVDAA